MNMINFIICDDNEIIRKNIREIINQIMMKNNFEYKVHEFDDYDKKFLKFIDGTMSNRIYILDIETPSESGINVARKIRENDIDSVIIFLTSHYELGPSLLEDELMFLTFISKFNNQDERLKSAINKALKMIGKKQAIRFEDHGILYTIPIKDILYITYDSVSRKCIIKTDYNDFKINKSFSEMSSMVENIFVKTHRSCLVNKDRVSIINKKNNTITFDNNITIDLLSTNYRKEMV